MNLLNVFQKGKRDIDNNENIVSENILRIKEFDLNIENILENWEVYHAIREIIANALDEQTITNTKGIDIKQANDGKWHIIDYGRGLNYHHLTQNENAEKLNNEKLIGRFGVGLKDALATLYRHNVSVEIKSKYGIITLKMASKIGFDDITTLHAEITAHDETTMIGTDISLYGCTEEDIKKAKSLFLKFSKESVVETTKYGEVIENKGNESNIYINGVKVAEETNFLFSYNITSLTSQIKRSLNRERTNVGRTAYSSRIKDILKECTSGIVVNRLIEDLQEFGSGNRHDETTWNDVALYASKKMSELNETTVFVTSKDLEQAPSLIDDMRSNGYKPVIVTENLITKIEDYNTGAEEREVITTSRQYIIEEQNNFSPEYLDPYGDLNDCEIKIYCYHRNILSLITNRLPCDKPIKIKIAETIYKSELFTETKGRWHEEENCIIIKRTQLCSLEAFAGTLIHEYIHAATGADDVSREFENKLTDLIGYIIDKYFTQSKERQKIQQQFFDYKRTHCADDERYNIIIEELGLSVRSFNCLKRAGINTVDDLINKSEEEMMKVKNISEKSFDEVKEKLQSMGLAFRVAEG